MKPSSHAEYGYTLLELLVSLALIGLMAAIATPMAGRILEGAELRADARALATTLARIQREAIAREKTVIVQFQNGALVTSEGEPLALDHASVTRFASGDDQLTYYPDGTSSGATIRVGGSDRVLALQVAWLTGAIRVTEGAQ